MDPTQQRILSHIKLLNEELSELRDTGNDHERDDVRKHGELDKEISLLRQALDTFQSDAEKRLVVLEKDVTASGEHKVADLQKALEAALAEKKAVEQAATAAAHATMKTAIEEAVGAERKRVADKEERGKTYMRLTFAALIGAVFATIFASLWGTITGKDQGHAHPQEIPHHIIDGANSAR